ncbi:MAG: glycosyltransferase N-terminal domain-containing protein, partial [Rikenellaceae bacterium]
MTFLYNAALSFYQCAISILAPIHPKAKQWSEGRRDIFTRLTAALKGDVKPVAWFHCASLGEFEQGRPVIEKFSERYPSHTILITFFSPSGYEVRKNYKGADHIFYLPIDTTKNVKRFLDIVKPEVAVFVKYEFWKNYLQELHRRDIKTYVVSAIFRPSQLFFKPYGKSYAKILKNITHLFVQNAQSKDLLHSIGIDNTTVCGDTRFDRVYSIATSAAPIPLFEKFANKSEVFISGSSWEKDDEITLKLIEKFTDLKFVIAPHELGEVKIKLLYESISKMGRKVIRYTQITDQDQASKCDVIIIDTMGILSKVYRNATYAYIGGGFGIGIHNTLEAATFGLPMIFGPNYTRFMEAVTLKDMGVATPITSSDDAIKWLNDLRADKAKYNKLND